MFGDEECRVEAGIEAADETMLDWLSRHYLWDNDDGCGEAVLAKLRL
jgi:hypothetical protein